MAGALLPVALTWPTAGAANNEGEQLLIIGAIPDCSGNRLTIHGVHFEEPLEVTLGLVLLDVITVTENEITAVLPSQFCGPSASYVLTVTRTGDTETKKSKRRGAGAPPV